MNLGEEQRMKGILTIDVVDAAGKLIDTRHVANLITRAGKHLLANLLMGKVAAMPSEWAIVVGIGSSSPKISDIGLENKAASATATTKVEIVGADDTSVVRATVSAQLPALAPSQQSQPLVEAGIELQTGSEKVLFNRVTFDTVNRGAQMIMNLTWEITF